MLVFIYIYLIIYVMEKPTGFKVEVRKCRIADFDFTVIEVALVKTSDFSDFISES